MPCRRTGSPHLDPSPIRPQGRGRSDDPFRHHAEVFPEPVPQRERPASVCPLQAEPCSVDGRRSLWRPRGGARCVGSEANGPRPVGWLALGVAWASVAIPGCSPQVAAERVPPPPVVSVVEARRMTVPIMAEPIGTTRALQEVSIRARVRGFLKEMHFEEGGDVKAGQLLFVIDEEPFKAKLAEAQAKLEAGRGRPEAGARLQGAGGRDGTARARPVACSNSPRSRSDASSRCSKRNATSVEDVQRKQALRKTDAAQVEADQASLEQAKADYETSILAAQAEVDGGEGPGHRRRDRPELLPDVLADRRPDRPGRGQAGEPRRPGGRRAAAATTPSWRSSGSSTRWASTSRSPPATSTGWRG